MQKDCYKTNARVNDQGRTIHNSDNYDNKNNNNINRRLNNCSNNSISLFELTIIFESA